MSLVSMYFSWRCALRLSNHPDLAPADRAKFAARALRVQAQAIGKVMAAALMAA